MKNENKCFFSVSLENGITITGDNPKVVREFLSDLSLCVDDAIKSGINDKHYHWKEYIEKLKNQLDNAWLTIHNNENKERD